jgi:chromosome segregation ATPase
VEKTMSMKEAYVKKLQAQLDEWDSDIGRLKAKADNAKADGQLAYYKQIESLREQQLQAQNKLNELRQTSEAAWEDLKAGMESAWDSMGRAVKSAASHFK